MKKKRKLILLSLLIVGCTLYGCVQVGKQDTLLLTEEKTGQDEVNTNAVIAEEVIAEEEAVPTPSGEPILVYVCGAVVNPGVYSFGQNGRIYEAVEAAGGFREEASSDYLNQAGILTDGMRLYVPTVTEVQEATENGLLSTDIRPENPDSEDRININTATKEMLLTLPGIGEGKAQKIITYREKNGSFQAIEDIMKVEGIKDGLFQKIKELIRI